MSAVDAAKIWSLNYRVLLSVISSAEDEICSLGLESKELFLLAEIDDHPYPAELATTLNMPKATVTVYLKRLEAAGLQEGKASAGTPTEINSKGSTGRQAACGLA